MSNEHIYLHKKTFSWYWKCYSIVMPLRFREKMKVIRRSRLFIFVRSIRAWQILYGARKVQNLVTVRGDTLQAFRPENAPILLDNTWVTMYKIKCPVFRSFESLPGRNLFLPYFLEGKSVWYYMCNVKINHVKY